MRMIRFSEECKFQTKWHYIADFIHKGGGFERIRSFLGDGRYFLDAVWDY